LKLLALTNFYPPLGYGYGAICADVMESLQKRGHECAVLCVEGGEGAAVKVQTGLGAVLAGWRKPLRARGAEVRSQRLVREALRGGVDAALIFHMRGVGKGSLTLLHDAGIPVVYLLGDLWVVYERPGPPSWWGFWQVADHNGVYRAARAAAARVAGLGKLELRSPPIASEGIVCFASAWLCDRYAAAGFKPRSGHIVPNGVRVDELAALRVGQAASSREGGTLVALFAGRLEAAKGAHIAVDAIARVEGVDLVVLGGGDERAVRALTRRIGELGLEHRVSLAGEVSRDAVTRHMARADFFLMPAEQPDAFGLVYIEAMATGAVVIGTARGGPAEFCIDGENSLVLPPDPGAVADGLARLRDDPALCLRLRDGARRTAERYTLTAMVDKVEALLPSGGARRPFGLQ